MNSKAIRKSINTGMIFGVILLFLALIGFTVTGSVILSKLFGTPVASGTMPGLPFFLLFLGLLGLWNGATAARPEAHKHKTLAATAVDSLSAGLTTGLMLGVLALIYGQMLAIKLDPRAYLAMISPDSMRLFLFNQSAPIAFLFHLGLMALSALAGGLLAYGARALSPVERVRGWAERTITQTSVAERMRRAPYLIWVLYALVAVLLFFLPRAWGSYWNYIIGTVGIYVILGLGLNIIVGLAGQLVLGYVAFFAIGAYSVALLTAPAPLNLEWNFWLALVIGVILSALTGMLLGLPILRLRGDYLAIVTLGFGEIIRILLKSDLLTAFTAGPKGVRSVGGPDLFGRPFTSDVDFMYLIIVAVLLIIFVARRLQNSRTGRSWMAIREDEIAARATGINTFQSKLLALAIGAAFAGLGGALFASRNQFTGPDDHILMVSINVLALVIVGGMGNIPGVILGAFVLKGLPEMLRELDVYRLLVFGALLVVMMVLRPEGLWPGGRPRLENLGADQAAGAASVRTTGKTETEMEGVQHATKP